MMISSRSSHFSRHQWLLCFLIGLLLHLIFSFDVPLKTCSLSKIPIITFQALTYLSIIVYAISKFSLPWSSIMKPLVSSYEVLLSIFSLTETSFLDSSLSLLNAPKKGLSYSFFYSSSSSKPSSSLSYS